MTWIAPGRVCFSDDGGEPPSLSSPGDVLVRVTAAGICATDVHLIEGRLRLVEPPAVLGHEIAGRVEACGCEVHRFRLGDRVKCDSVIGCGACSWCVRGATQFCPRGCELGLTRPGGWAEFVVVPERNLHALPDLIPDDVAAIMDVEVVAAMRKLAIQPGETVAVFGPGPAGLIAVQLARLWGASKVILCGTRPDRLALGKKLGAHVTVDVRRQPAAERIREETEGAGADAGFEAAGTACAVRDLIAALRPQGRGVLYGLHGAPMPGFPVDEAVLKDLTLCAALPDRTGWDELIGWVASGALDLASLITHRLPLERAEEAVSLLLRRSPGALKVVLQVS
ncbi:MAG: alcohol dehydrogenase catalytic domain-containing protein [Bryobacterales bacterium]|nr:alcohol dehydrogenase catalytic domain-containing protein [Bryobacteraceae bacterium]MDW8131399.1 alcohol dehydrogenase catalytic domain-containing protein [Bryobacterales bacterium]